MASVTISDHSPLQVTKTICDALWGNQLSFHPFNRGDAPVEFTSLWPRKPATLVETYTHANIEQAPYELCKLLVATNSAQSLDALLEERILQVNQTFNSSLVTLAHLACVVGVRDVLKVLVKRSQSNNSVWSLKDEDDHSPTEVCVSFHYELKHILPGRSSIFHKLRKISQGLPLKAEARDKIFELARNPDCFYQVLVQLKMYSFDVNRVRNSDADLLIHIAVKGGLAQLPLLFTLVRGYKASVTLTDGSGHTPLTLACKRGEMRIAEILICVFGVDINSPTASNGKTPLHWAVEYNHPSLVSMLLRRGADSSCEDMNRCVPSFVARRLRYHECRQVITQFQMERVTRLAREASDGTLDVSRLYTSDSCIVTHSGCTLLMLATLNNREATVGQLVTMEMCPLDFKQMKSCDIFDSSLDESISSQVTEITPDSDYSLKTAVHMAADGGFTGCLLALLEAGAQPAVPDASSWLPLHYATDRGHIDCVSTILNFPNQLGLCGLRPAADIARGNGQEQIVQLIEKAIQTRQTDLVNPLLFDVALSGTNETLFATLENGDNVNPTNELHDWPLILAAGSGHLELVEQLHEFGGHVTRRHTLSRCTPLHVAARGGHKDVVKYLLRFCLKGDGTCPPSNFPSGAAGTENHPPHLYINDRNTAGCTPLELAVSQGHLDVVKILLEHGASTTLPDSNGCQINCPSFAGTQFLMETHRKDKKRKIMACLNPKASIKDIQRVWESPSDFNLNKRNEDSFIMMAASSARPDVLQFFVDEAIKCRRSMLISPGQPLPSTGMYNSASGEDSSPDFLENSLPPNFKLQPNDHAHPHTALPAPYSHKGAEVTVTSLGPTPFTALPSPRSNGHHKKGAEVTVTSLGPTPFTALPSPRSHDHHKKGAEVTVTSLGPMLPLHGGRVESDPCDGVGAREAGGDLLLLESRTALPQVLRTQVPNNRGASRRNVPPKKPPRLRQRTASEMPPRVVGLLKRKAWSGGSSATPLSEEDEPVRRQLPGVGERAGPVANGYRGGVSSEAESGAENKGREFSKLLHFSNPIDGRTALHRAAEACRHDNITVLLRADEELANMKDIVGNTALHLACLKAHKQTVKALLAFKCVSTVIRNSGKELPEERCMRRDVRKMVAKARQAQHGNNIPSSPEQPLGMASVGVADNGVSRLSDIHEASAPTAAYDENNFKVQFDTLKEEYDKKHDSALTSSKD